MKTIKELLSRTVIFIFDLCIVATVFLAPVVLVSLIAWLLGV